MYNSLAEVYLFAIMFYNFVLCFLQKCMYVSFALRIFFWHEIYLFLFNLHFL